MQNITLLQLQDWQSKNIVFQLIDVREKYEHDKLNIGGELIPLGDLMKHVGLINKNIPVVFYCRKGIRSQLAIQKLQKNFHFKNLYNLVGGIGS